MRVGILGSGLMGGSSEQSLREPDMRWYSATPRSEQKLKTLHETPRGQGASRHTARGRAGSRRGIACRALVANRGCAESDRRFVGQGDRNLLPLDE